MIDFFHEHAIAIYWFLGIVLTSVLLFVFVDRFSKKLINNAIEKGYDDFSFIKLISRILKVFIVLFFLLFLTFYFVDKENYKFIIDNIKIIAWITFVAVFTIISLKLSSTLFNRIIKKKTLSGENPTSYKFLKHVSTFTLVVMGIALAAYAFPTLRGLANTAIGGAGILAVIVGVASQEALANVVGGLFIIIFKPFKLHDVVKISDDMVGEVMDITLRHTVIKNYQNKMIVIPNAIINKEKVINYNLGDLKCCQWIEVGISYDSDIDLAKEIIRTECLAHKSLIDNRTPIQKENNDPIVIVRVIGLNDSEVSLRAWAWAQDFPTAFIMKCDLLESIKKRFDKEGIEIPFPHRTMVFKEQQLNKLTN